ncbi:MAG: LptF/LptG family permease, partial [Alphaproteobacteria bacterium]|nr:LptF/LptG family permease [Alphaproteobacteria bacterium]
MTKRRIKLFSTINFYFARRFVFWFMVVAASLLFVIFLFEMIELLRRSMTRLDIGSRVLLQIGLLKLPYYFQMFYPFIVMVSSQITLWRFNQTQEIIAVRSLGFAVRHIVTSFMMTVLALSIMNIVIFNPVAALTQQRAELQHAMVFKHQGPNQLHITDSGLWLRERHDDQAYIIHVGA